MSSITARVPDAILQQHVFSGLFADEIIRLRQVENRCKNMIDDDPVLRNRIKASQILRLDVKGLSGLFALLSQEPDYLYFFSELFALKGSYLEYTPAALKNNRKIVVAALRQNAHALQHASLELRQDHKVVLAAVQQYGKALQHASVEVRNDRDIVLAAVQQNGKALEHASLALRNDPEIVLTAVQENTEKARGPEDFGRKVPKYRQIGLAAAHRDLSALHYASRTIKNNRDIVLAAVRNQGRALQFASETLRNDREIALAAIQQDPYALHFVSEQLRIDPDIISAVLEHRSKESSHDDFEADPDFVFIAPDA